MSLFHLIDDSPVDGETLRFDADALRVQAAEQFALELIRLNDPNVVQTFYALWGYAYRTQRFQFEQVALEALMEGVIQKSHLTDYSPQERCQFSQGLSDLSALTISLRIVAERITQKGKKDLVLFVEHGVHLFRLHSAYYRLKPAYQDQSPPVLTEGHFETSIITQFSGELLPGYHQVSAKVARPTTTIGPLFGRCSV